MKAKIGFAAMVSVFALAACGDSNKAAEAPQAEPQAAAEATATVASPVDEANVVVVQMWDDGTSFKFEPAKIEVQQGQVIRYVHAGTQPHNVEFVKDGAPAGVDLGEYASGHYLMNKGETYEVKVDERFVPGTYPYICTPHVSMGMKGEVVVKN